VSLLEPPPRTDPDALARIRGWAHELWNLPDEATVIVSELRCAEPGCPPIETVVLVSRKAGDTFQIKLAKPAAAVTATDLQGASADEHRH
jgi:hypothetical protein